MYSRIQKKAYFFWEGPLSWLRFLTLFSFRKFNPEWDMVLYTTNEMPLIDIPWETNESVDCVGFNGTNFITDVKALKVDVEIFDINSSCRLTPNYKSDLFRWWILSNHSGFYVDMDFIFVKPIDRLFDRVAEYDVVTCWTGDYWSIGFLGSNCECSLFNDLFVCRDEQNNELDYQSFGVNLLDRLFHNHGCVNTIDTLERLYSDCSIYNLDVDIFYPYRWNQTHLLFEDNISLSLDEDTVAVHWFGGTQGAQACIKSINEHNYKNWKSFVIGQLIDRILND